MSLLFHCGRYKFPFSGGKMRPLVMGVLNVTPDSFSDGGRYSSLDFTLSRAEQMIAEGVDIIDIGGESSRPGAQALSLDEELNRVMPVLYALRDCGKPISIDTYKPEMMHEVIVAGADMINDIKGFRAEGALDAVKDSDCGLCIMHMQSTPQAMQFNPKYHNVTADVAAFLLERVAILTEAGISRSRLCVDPGFGFGKTLAHNILLLQKIGEIQKAIGLPLLAGMSRKSMIGTITGKSVENRLAGSLSAALVAASNGAHILRVHDVAETVDALAVWYATTK
jgi:dihydropteroate synthase